MSAIAALKVFRGLRCVRFATGTVYRIHKAAVIVSRPSVIRGTVYLISSRQSVAYHPALTTWPQFSQAPMRKWNQVYCPRNFRSGKDQTVVQVYLPVVIPPVNRLD